MEATRGMAARPVARRERGLHWPRFLPTNIVLPILAFLLLLLVWQLGYGLTKFLPSPLEVARSFPKLLGQENLLGNVIATFRRVIVGLAIATALSMVSAVLMALSPKVERIVNVYVFVALSIPSIAAAIFGLMVFGFSDLGSQAAVALITYPFITIGIRDGVTSIDKQMLEVADVYQYGIWRKLRHIIIPNMEPYLLVALRNAHALGWKIAVISEVFQATKSGIGGQYMRAFDNFHLDQVIFWLTIFLISVFIVEYGVLRQVERRLFRWRVDTSLAK